VTDANGRRDMIFIGKRFTAQEGKQLGFIDAVVPHDQLLESSLKIANAVKSKASTRHAYQALKNNIYYRTVAALQTPVPSKL
jgi:enoyl-CoA hydratase/carnithine racemase